ncbi:hypothetical protein HK099_003264, partial [Clydaea vesicula]
LSQLYGFSADVVTCDFLNYCEFEYMNRMRPELMVNWLNYSMSSEPHYGIFKGSLEELFS